MGGEEGALLRSKPLPHLSLYFSAHISSRRPHDLNAWNRLGRRVLTRYETLEMTREL